MPVSDAFWQLATIAALSAHPVLIFRRRADV